MVVLHFYLGHHWQKYFCQFRKEEKKKILKFLSTQKSPAVWCNVLLSFDKYTAIVKSFSFCCVIHLRCVRSILTKSHFYMYMYTMLPTMDASIQSFCISCCNRHQRMSGWKWQTVFVQRLRKLNEDFALN